MPPDSAPIRPFAGRWVKAVFTIRRPGRYAVGMVIFASLALAAAALAVPLERAERQAPEPVRQATASVTILRSEPLRFAEIEREQPQLLRDTLVRGADGSMEKLRLVEFP